jgi:hypothetical protein
VATGTTPLGCVPHDTMLLLPTYSQVQVHVCSVAKRPLPVETCSGECLMSMACAAHVRLSQHAATVLCHIVTGDVLPGIGDPRTISGCSRSKHVRNVTGPPLQSSQGRGRDGGATVYAEQQCWRFCSLARHCASGRDNQRYWHCTEQRNALCGTAFSDLMTASRFWGRKTT